MQPSYAPPAIWNGYFSEKARTHDDLNPEGLWAKAWIPLWQRYPSLQRWLDLGCGTGGDSLRLAGHGYQMTGLDYAHAALERADAKAKMAHLAVEWIQGDMAHPLPFDEHTFDGVMSNVALHMFDDRTTRRIVEEIQRILIPNGLFCFHLNSVADMPYRALRYQRVREIEANYWLEAHGQTMHFFDETYLRTILSQWQILHLEHHALRDQQSGEIFKCVWQGIVQKPVR